MALLHEYPNALSGADPRIDSAMQKGEVGAAAEAFVRSAARQTGNFPGTFTNVSRWARADLRTRRKAAKETDREGKRQATAATKLREQAVCDVKTLLRDYPDAFDGADASVDSALQHGDLGAAAEALVQWAVGHYGNKPATFTGVSGWTSDERVRKSSEKVSHKQKEPQETVDWSPPKLGTRVV
jgi:hypothetical protein